MARNKHGTEDGTKTEWQPPRGIRYKFIDGNPRPFGVVWREDGRERAKFFAAAEDRERYARNLADEKNVISSQRREFTGFTAEGWQEYDEAKKIADGADLRDVARQWLAGGGQASKLKEVTVEDAVNDYLQKRYAGGIDRNSDTGRHFELHLRKRFAGLFGADLVSDITPDAIRQWLDSIKSKKTGEAIGDLAKRHHRKDVNTFFLRAIAEGWCEKNPCDLVDLPKIPAKDVQILTVEKARKLLEANKGQPIVARLALEMFGALRASSVERLKKEHIDFDRKGIRLPGDLHKSGKAKFRQGHPDILWKWLADAPEKTWTDIDEGNYGHEKVKAVQRAFGPDGSIPHNALRHSFASYHLAAFKSLSITSYLMQHTSTHTTTIYEGVATEADAKAYFEIFP